MAAIDFPNSPATNDSFTSAGRTWLYNGTAWTLLTLTQTVIPSNSVTSSSIVNDSIVNADINSSAAIAYSKLSLSNTVVDADINSSAAIAATKISGTAIVQSIVDAKGDLIAGSADNTVARLAVGTNDFPLVADSAATNGLSYKQLPAAGLADRSVGSEKLTGLTLNAQTGTSYTLVLTDAHDLVTLSNASAITLTIPTNASVAFTIGDQVNIVQLGAGQVTVGGAGVTLRSQGSKLKLNGQYSAATLIKIGTDEWVLVGNTAA